MISSPPPLPRPFAAVLAVVVVLGTSLAVQPIARADETPPPVLWEGEIRTPEGTAAGGADVVAYARPPATSIEPGQELVEVARTTTARSGRFVLRAWPDTALTLADAAGWTTIMLTALSGEVSGESGGPGFPARDANQLFGWDADMVFKRLTWGCGGEYNYYFIDTVEPVQWTGGMWQYPGTAEPPCNGRFRVPVGPNRHYERREGSSITFQAGIAVAGFRGAVTSAVSRAVTYRWHNTVGGHRFLCGSSESLTDNTRVASLA